MRLVTFQRENEGKFTVSVNNHVRQDKSSMFAVLRVRDPKDNNEYSFHFDDVTALREFAANINDKALNPEIVDTY